MLSAQAAGVKGTTSSTTTTTTTGRKKPPGIGLKSLHLADIEEHLGESPLNLCSPNEASSLSSERLRLVMKHSKHKKMIKKIIPSMPASEHHQLSASLDGHLLPSQSKPLGAGGDLLLSAPSSSRSVVSNSSSNVGELGGRFALGANALLDSSMENDNFSRFISILSTKLDEEEESRRRIEDELYDIQKSALDKRAKAKIEEIQQSSVFRSPRWVERKMKSIRTQADRLRTDLERQQAEAKASHAKRRLEFNDLEQQMNKFQASTSLRIKADSSKRTSSSSPVGTTAGKLTTSLSAAAALSSAAAAAATPTEQQAPASTPPDDPPNELQIPITSSSPAGSVATHVVMTPGTATQRSKLKPRTTQQDDAISSASSTSSHSEAQIEVRLGRFVDHAPEKTADTPTTPAGQLPVARLSRGSSRQESPSDAVDEDLLNKALGAISSDSTPALSDSEAKKDKSSAPDAVAPGLSKASSSSAKDRSSVPEAEGVSKEASPAAEEVESDVIEEDISVDDAYDEPLVSRVVVLEEPAIPEQQTTAPQQPSPTGSSPPAARPVEQARTSATAALIAGMASEDEISIKELDVSGDLGYHENNADLWEEVTSPLKQEQTSSSDNEQGLVDRPQGSLGKPFDDYPAIESDSSHLMNNMDSSTATVVTVLQPVPSRDRRTLRDMLGPLGGDSTSSSSSEDILSARARGSAEVVGVELQLPEDHSAEISSSRRSTPPAATGGESPPADRLAACIEDVVRDIYEQVWQDVDRTNVLKSLCLSSSSPAGTSTILSHPQLHQPISTDMLSLQAQATASSQILGHPFLSSAEQEHQASLVQQQHFQQEEDPSSYSPRRRTVHDVKNLVSEFVDAVRELHENYPDSSMYMPADLTKFLTADDLTERLEQKFPALFRKLCCSLSANISLTGGAIEILKPSGAAASGAEPLSAEEEMFPQLNCLELLVDTFYELARDQKYVREQLLDRQQSQRWKTGVGVSPLYSLKMQNQKPPTWQQFTQLLCDECLRFCINAPHLGNQGNTGARDDTTVEYHFPMQEEDLDRLLFAEIKEEEKNWLHVDTEIVQVKHQLADDLFEDLLGECVLDLVRIFKGPEELIPAQESSSAGADSLSISRLNIN
ncbi:unnamed protein product [Amoebophrya sp. A120]|nr:unnamed protein product [Amoebophrya sp. A120]|eukprot:GSA120T00018486001.1